MPRGVQFHPSPKPRVDVRWQTIEPHEDWHLDVLLAPGNYVLQVDFTWREDFANGLLVAEVNFFSIKLYFYLIICFFLFLRSKTFLDKTFERSRIKNYILIFLQLNYIATS